MGKMRIDHRKNKTMRIYILRSNELMSNILIIAETEEEAVKYADGKEIEEVLEPNKHHDIRNVSYLFCIE